MQIVQLLVHHKLGIQKGMYTFYFLGSICRKQILTDQYLVILNCVNYCRSSLRNKTPHTFVLSKNDTIAATLFIQCTV